MARCMTVCSTNQTMSQRIAQGIRIMLMVASREWVVSLVPRPPGFSTASVYIFQSVEQDDPLRGVAKAVLMMGSTMFGLLALQGVTGSNFR